jgi:hypothetical protein
MGITLKKATKATKGKGKATAGAGRKRKASLMEHEDNLDNGLEVGNFVNSDSTSSSMLIFNLRASQFSGKKDSDLPESFDSEKVRRAVQAQKPAGQQSVQSICKSQC